MATGKIKKVAHVKSTAGYKYGDHVCPNLYRRQWEGGLFGGPVTFYCTAMRKEIDQGYVNRVCLKVDKPIVPISCNYYNGRIYPYNG